MDISDVLLSIVVLMRTGMIKALRDIENEMTWTGIR